MVILSDFAVLEYKAKIKPNNWRRPVTGIAKCTSLFESAGEGQVSILLGGIVSVNDENIERCRRERDVDRCA